MRAAARFGMIASIACVALCREAGAVTPRACVEAHERGLTLRQAHKLTQARPALLACAVDGCPTEVRRGCEKLLEEVNEGMPTIVLAARDESDRDVAGATFAIDGGTARPVDGNAIEVDPGEHRFVLEGPGHTPVERTFVVRETEKGRREVVVLGTQPKPREREASNRPEGMPTGTGDTSRTFAYALGGVAIVAAGLGTFFGVRASSTWSRAKNDCGVGCGPDDPAYAERGDARTAAAASTVSFVVAGVALAAAVVLFATARPSRRSTVLALTPAGDRPPRALGLSF